MNNFQFHNPVKIVFGKNALDNLGTEIADLGKRVLLVFGKAAIKKIGLYDKVVEILKKEGLDIIDYGGVKANPY
jgi:alcohol dehydrogenase YqhD (iron-dependent ADH family)